MFADAVTVEDLREAMLVIGLQQGVRVVALVIAAFDRDDVLGAIHVVIRRRHNVGPMRFDIGQVQAPGLVSGSVDEFHGACGRVGRFRVLFRNAGRLVGVFQKPTRQNLAVVSFARVGPLLPRVGTAVLQAAQIVIVMAGFTIAGRMKSVEPVPGFEAAFRLQDADGRTWVDPEPLEAFGIGCHMRLAAQRCTHAQPA